MLLLFYFIDLKGKITVKREMERERKKLLFTGSLLKWLQWSVDVLS